MVLTLRSYLCFADTRGYWLVATALLGIAGSVYSAWVLLVEIVR